MIEAITPKENRDFDTSLGNWTGDAVWDPGPIFTYTGLMKFTLEPYGPDKTVLLGYPNLKIQKNRTPILDMLSGVEFSVAGSPFFTFLIKDDMGTEIPWDTPYYPIESWQHFYWTFTAPPGWNEGTGKILITLHAPDEAEGSVYIDSFSLQYEVPTKPQYLPLMGVG